MSVALMECDILLIHIIDANDFTKYKEKGMRIVEILTDGNTFEEACFVVYTGSEQVRLSYNFLVDVLFNFQSISSVAYQMLDIVDKTKTIEYDDIDQFEKATDNPTVHYLETLDDAEKFAYERNASGKDYVIMSPKLLNLLNRAQKEPEYKSEFVFISKSEEDSEDI